MVLTVLALAANETVTIDHLVDALWGDYPPKSARNSVARFIADLRTSLGRYADRLESVSGGYRLIVNSSERDIDQAQQQLEGVATGEHSSTSLRQVVELIGAAPNEMLYELNGYDTIERSHSEIRISLTEQLANALLADENHTELIDVLDQAVVHHPYHERFWYLLVLAFDEAGRRAQAIAVAQRFRAVLDELGVAPPDEFLQLESRVVGDLTATNSGVRTAANGPRERLPNNDPDPAEVSHPDLPPQLERALSPSLVGREALMEYGSEVVSLLGQGHPHVTFLGGEPGVGKTVLAAAFASLAADAGGHVFYGRSDEDIALPMAAWTEVLGQMLTHHRRCFEAAVHSGWAQPWRSERARHRWVVRSLLHRARRRRRGRSRPQPSTRPSRPKEVAGRALDRSAARRSSDQGGGCTLALRRVRRRQASLRPAE